jgi:bifunctional non-homologous end joining protein LigD
MIDIVMVMDMDLNLLKPMEPVLSERPFDDDDYLYQVKWDGIRLLSKVSSIDGVMLWTKKGQLRTETYPELLKIDKILKGNNAVLDGEVIVLGEQGLPSFNRVLRRDLAKKVTKAQITANPVIYVVFDLLYYNDRSFTNFPLWERQELLTDILKPAENIFLCDSYPKGKQLFLTMQEKGLEGIVAKEKKGRYYCGAKNRTWLKIKCFRKMECVVGGIVLKNGRAGALLLGLPSRGSGDGFTGVELPASPQDVLVSDKNPIVSGKDIFDVRNDFVDVRKKSSFDAGKVFTDMRNQLTATRGELIYIGRVYAGLKERELAQLQKIAHSYAQSFSPFSNPPPMEKGVQYVWLPPYLIVNVQYLEWSEKGCLRNPVILGFYGEKNK